MTQHTPPPDEPEHKPSGDHHRRRAHFRHVSDRSSGRRPAIDRGFELSAPLRFSSTPFAWQHGARLYLLVSDWQGWVLAELNFVPTACHYVEVRRAHYRWPREAAGALLSRSLTADEVTMAKLAADISSWLARADMQILPQVIDH